MNVDRGAGALEQAASATEGGTPAAAGPACDTTASLERIAFLVHAPPLLSWSGRVQPVPLHRARVVFAGRSPRTYLTDADEVHRAELRVLWRRLRRDVALPLAGPLALLVTFAGNSRDRLDRRHHYPRPDATNLLKAIEDAGNGHLWVDDRQIEIPIAHLRAWGPDVRPFVALDVWGLT
jgi:Holliday junction resolvase RusA-like endonuclease